MVSENEKVQWAIMDTFDALGADKPKTYLGMKRLVKNLKNIDYDILSGSNGWVLNLKKTQLIKIKLILSLIRHLSSHFDYELILIFIIFITIDRT